MAAARIFISYRRDDSAGFARAIGEALGARFGREQVWLDVDDIGAGDAFDAEIDRAVGTSGVLLVLIGTRWLGAAGAGGERRIDDPDDFVRHEVLTGLTRGLPVVPLLLDGAPMPAEADLPDPLKPLARRQALPVDNARFDADIARLEGVIRRHLNRPFTLTPARRGLLALAVAAVAGCGAWAWRRSQDRPAVNGRWRADVVYDWPNARYTEVFEFDGEDRALHGKAGFVGAPRGIVEGEVLPGGRIGFVLRTRESMTGEADREAVHRYAGRLEGDTIRFVMQTTGGFSDHVPVAFTARREP